jgi:hypothetical protein
MTTINTYKDLEQEIGDKKTLVFGGFSGLGYSDIEKLEEEARLKIEQEIEIHGKDNVAVVCGATSDGIGAIYKIAKDYNLPTYGIVSEAAKEYGSDSFCDKTFFVPDPKNTWQVLSENGESYMVDIAKKNGVLIYFGGGDVAVSEIKEANQKGIATDIDTSFEPNESQVAKRIAKNPNFDPTPLKTYINEIGIIKNILGNISSKRAAQSTTNQRLVSRFYGG